MTDKRAPSISGPVLLWTQGGAASGSTGHGVWVRARWRGIKAAGRCAIDGPPLRPGDWAGLRPELERRAPVAAIKCYSTKAGSPRRGPSVAQLIVQKRGGFGAAARRASIPRRAMGLVGAQ
ncbi:hypothetical protein HAT86_06705 [Roseovarius gahaiensis]|uniref:Uncharacterized protein n=1 Tax=Roseovarius gahaiensis TaxID=2716691 RepID=A0A967BDZ0_9RHOB|nr:hypothetical protein [Roseovarius gahaiensis]NHQ74156.1 hypothetical protein [Roseovarius gahaiensis]